MPNRFVLYCLDLMNLNDIHTGPLFIDWRFPTKSKPTIGYSHEMITDNFGDPFTFVIFKLVGLI